MVTVNCWCWLQFQLLSQWGLMFMNLFMNVRTLSVQGLLNVFPFPALPSPLVSILVQSVCILLQSFQSMVLTACGVPSVLKYMLQSKMLVSCGRALAKNCWSYCYCYMSASERLGPKYRITRVNIYSYGCGVAAKLRNLECGFTQGFYTLELFRCNTIWLITNTHTTGY